MILVADNLQALNPLVARALQDLDPAPIREMARFCQKAGARFLDLNPGYLSRRQEDRMTFLVETVQEATDLDLVLDSPNPRLLARGLAACRKKPMLNALTREPSKIAEILPLAVEHQTRLVILLIDENSMAPRSLDEKIALAVELREICLSAGLSHQQLIFDPVMPSLGQPDAFHLVGQVMDSIRLLASGAIFQDQAATMLGFSNLRSGHKTVYPVELEKMSLALAAGAGLTHALADLRQEEITAAARTIERFNQGLSIRKLMADHYFEALIKGQPRPEIEEDAESQPQSYTIVFRGWRFMSDQDIRPGGAFCQGLIKEVLCRPKTSLTVFPKRL